MKKTFLLSVLLLCALFVQAQEAPTAQQITDLANKVQELWRVPTMAVTVVKDGETVFAEGFGKLSLKADAPQSDQYTLFVNASTSKAFTAALMAMLVDRGYVKWTDPVKLHLSDFELYDPWVTENFLVQDIMNHKTGFQSNALDQVPSLGYNRDDLYRMLKFIKPTYGFRTTYAYCNFTFTIAAKIIEKYFGMTWEDAVEEYIFKPLEMEHARTGKDSYFEAENFAYGYSLYKTNDGLKLSPRNDREVTYDWLQAVSPAAFIMCNAHDMGQWMQMWLNSGKYNGKQIISKENVNFLWKPQTICSSNDKQMVLYAQGWRVEQGEQGRLINHTGLAGGYTAWVALAPEYNLGVSVLTNVGTTTSAALALGRAIIDLYRGVDSDWITRQYQDYLKPSSGSATRKPKEEPKSALAFSAYQGRYFKEVFGPVDIYTRNEQLWIRIKEIDAPMKHINGNTFRFDARDETFDLTFQMNQASRVADSFVIDFDDDLGAFTRLYTEYSF